MLVIDDNGDGIADRLVLKFHTGTGQESQLVFDLAAHAGSSFQIGDFQIGLGTLVAQAQVISGEQAAPVTLLTAAGEAAIGGGANVYSEDLGPPSGDLTPQGIIPPVFLLFGAPVVDLPVEDFPVPEANADMDMVLEGGAGVVVICEPTFEEDFEGGEGQFDLLGLASVSTIGPGEVISPPDGSDSAALMFTARMDRETEVLFVGEPGAGKPNSYSEFNEVNLPNSKLQGSISSIFHQEGEPDDTREAIPVDFPVSRSGEDDQPTAGLHQPMLQARQRPTLDPVRQPEPPPQITQVVGQYAEL